jgi:hypothetical protein
LDLIFLPIRTPKRLSTDSLFNETLLLDDQE